MSHIVRGRDGVYRWSYELNLYKNPTILILVMKIFGFILFGIWLFVTMLSLFENRFVTDDILEFTGIFITFSLGFSLFVAFGYFVYAMIMGGKYCVLFEMDENGVNHIQMPRQVKKAEMIGALAALAGGAAGSYTAMGAGILAASRSSMYSAFSKVKSVEVYPDRELIKVNELLGKNQVYAAKEDFDFVRDYIVSKCVNAKIFVNGKRFEKSFEE